MEAEPRAEIDTAVIGKAFLQTLVEDLGAVVILDGVDELPEGYRIRSHDLRGELPVVLIKRESTKVQDFGTLDLRERVTIEACKLYAVTRGGGEGD